MHQLRMSLLRPFSGWTKIPSSLPDFILFFPPLLYPKIFPRPTYHLPPPSYLPPTNPSPSLHRQSSWLQRRWAGASLELGAGLERERAWNLERAWSLERLQLDPRRTQVSISLCVASSLCCKKRRRRRRRWHRVLLLLCVVELATRSLQRKLRAPESSGACCNASFGASKLLRSLHFFHAASSEPWRAPELAELQRASELAATSSEFRIGPKLATASSEL
jgi:hypothetical protein